ncbi:P-loop containing nucleoside triphosphate hydrolase [Arabidopsis thaliana x Arabidopsis arenosa]|uniref:P-loop containing nucleoside triphosphate hydrolase n=1 Tax=Arabidopsis thaliana x Arabidopsis arenosa TaxID=1240361 RepID=A0A8T2ED62_9BRAS|nr:P-loop containing nucleoside triphosphate hydrolase [Arabidopsis thaliana x Arabidopsis arenosa]
MEQKSVLFSALGVGVGLGIGLASGQSLGKWANGSISAEDGLTGEKIEQELVRQIVDGRESSVTFDEFPYYLSEKTRLLLTSAAYVHLKQSDISKHTRNLAPGSKAILLSGPAEFYQQMLAKALAHYFESKLLLLDITDFSIKIQSKYGCVKKEPSHKRSISELTMDKMSNLMGSISVLSQKEATRGTLRRHTSGNDLHSRGFDVTSQPPRLKRNASAASDMSSISSRSATSVSASSKRSANLCFDERLFLQSLYKVLVSISETNPIIIYLRDVEKLCQSERFYKLFQRLLTKLSGPVLVLGSRLLEPEDDCQEVGEGISALFPYNIEIRPPEDENQLMSWKTRFEDDMKVIQFQDNKNHIAEVLAANDLECDDLGSICHADTMFLSSHIEEIVVSAISYHLMNNKEPEYKNGRLVISSNSLSHGLNILQEGQGCFEDSLKLDTNIDSKVEEGEGITKSESKSETTVPENKNESDTSIPAAKNECPLPPKAPEVAPDNEFEKRIRPEVIPANEIGLTCSKVVFKPCRGILLFGPPGTGKTMMAKAIANEAGASFINVSMSTITSKWFGEDEKNVRALFTLAAKVSPTIIFVDEVDSMLGQRTRVGEHEAMRKIKNEFMTHWDGLMSNAGDRILVLAATNRPFDLDEAIIRRFERRIMVGLPSVESREKILRTLLSKEKTENLDFQELAQMTDGYSGSDLKNFCTTAAYRPVRELIKQECLKDQERRKREEAEKNSEEGSEAKEEVSEERGITLRPLSMEDMKVAKSQVAASFAAEGAGMNELKQWNDLYGEGGSRKKEQLSYFL